jgi:large subunit ribosomal protein L2
METRIKVRQLSKGLVKISGRNDRGIITVRHRGGGNDIRTLTVDYKLGSIGLVGQILSVQKDVRRSGYISLVRYSNGFLSYVLSGEGFKEGQFVMHTLNGFRFKGVLRKGSIYFLKNFKEGEMGFNIEYNPGSGSKLARAAGAKVKIMKIYKDLNKVLIKLPSGEIRLLDGNCRGVIGFMSNNEHRYKKLYKAGQNRWVGNKPRVRGEAMNPVDHPHGGRTKAGRVPVTPWGELTKGFKTRDRKKKNLNILKRIKK